MHKARPALDEATLTSILEFDQRASLAGVMPYWLTQYSPMHRFGMRS